MTDTKTFLFHIGLPKTGSTSIQGALVTLSEALRAHGVYFPYDRDVYGVTFPNPAAPRGAPQDGGFTHFARAQQRKPDALDWAASIERFLADPALSHYVFSHENLAQAGPRLHTEVFRSLAARADLAFLVYLRHPLSYLTSFALWEITGRAGPTVRDAQAPTRVYLRDGFSGMLAPYGALGRVLARNFDVARQDGGLVADAFSAFGATAVLRDAPPMKILNVSRPHFGMACVLLALKATSSDWTQRRWFALRAKVVQASETLEPRMDTSLLTSVMADRIMARWRRDRDILARDFGIEMPLEEPSFRPGPDAMVFSRDYADRLRAAVADRIDAEETIRLERALALADTDVEAYIRTRQVPGQPVAPLFAVPTAGGGD